MMMNHRQDNGRPFIRPQVTRPRRRNGVARVIRLRRHGRRHDIRSVVAFALVALVVTATIVAALAVALRSARDVAGDLLPGWPWW